MTVAVRRPRVEKLVGIATPRIAPPTPTKSKVKEFTATAKAMGIELMPWQQIAGRYLTATDGNQWRYREVAIIVGRQNGKTELLLPRILMDLRAGKKILHTGQVRTLPRVIFERLLWHLDPSEMKRRYDGRIRRPREANGQEQIEMANGGWYRIVAAQRGARGLSADTIIIDELREFEDEDIIGAMAPTLTASKDPQRVYLSNAGTHKSVILNGLKRRAESENGERLAYLEWSATPDRALDDREGWAEANPALGHLPSLPMTLADDFASMTGGQFATEHLCQWMPNTLPSVVSEAAWNECVTTVGEKPSRPMLGISMHPNGARASVVMAWQMTDGRVAVVDLLEATGSPIDTATLGPDIEALRREHGAKRVAYASWTDKDIERHIRAAEALDGKDFAAASEFFARAVMQGRLAVDGGAKQLTDDVKWAARKPHDSGSWVVTHADPDRPITAFLAAVRAVWLASQPRTVPRIG